MTNQTEVSLGEIYDCIADTLSQSRILCLQGKRCEAIKVYEAASQEFNRFQPELRGFSGYVALQEAFIKTCNGLDL